MTLAISSAKAILQQRLGSPVKDVKYILGFRTNAGRVLALHPEQQETRLWYQLPEAPSLAGVRRIAPAKNADLNGPVAALAGSLTPRVEIADAEALHRFLDWYASPKIARPASASAGTIDPSAFRDAFARFQALMTAKSGRPFVHFGDGLIYDYESYKPRLRGRALELLQYSQWSEADVGSGMILNRIVQAIEIQDSQTNLTNNLVFWQNRFGHANRDHRILLEAESSAKLRHEIEYLLFGLFRGDTDQGATFDQLSEVTGGKYPLLAYLYFLRDMDRFMPIQPTGFDRAFRALGIDFTTLRQCDWGNYSTYNRTLTALRPLIETSAGLESIRLVDSHSFCWIFAWLLKQEADGLIVNGQGGKDHGRYLGGREKSIIEMRLSVESTVKNSNGQVVQRTLKNKELRMSSAELEKHIASLLDLQDNRCALTGIPLQFQGLVVDKNLKPSLDRINSTGHYEVGNLQVVCQFINFWKSDADNAEFRRLLMLVRLAGSEGPSLDDVSTNIAR